MAVLNTRVKNLDPLTKQVVEYVLNNGSSDAIKIQFAFNIELERVGTILDDCVAKERFIQNILPSSLHTATG